MGRSISGQGYLRDGKKERAEENPPKRKKEAFPGRAEDRDEEKNS